MGSFNVLNTKGVSKTGRKAFADEKVKQRAYARAKLDWPYLNTRKRLESNLEKFRHAAIPQLSWMYKVFFHVNTETFKIYNDKGFPNFSDLNFELNPISCSLPTEEVHTAEQFYLGTKRTVTTYKDRSGECTMEFYYRDISTSMKLNDKAAESYKNLSFFNLLSLAYPVLDTKMTDVQRIQRPIHTELLNPLFSKITISLFNADTSAANDYILVNPIITNIEHSTELGYETEDAVKWTITIHYDWWESVSYA